MRDLISPEMSVNMVMMMRASVDGAIILADDPGEGQLLELGAHKSSRVVPAFGSAVLVLKEMYGRGVAGVVGVSGAPNVVPGLPVFAPSLGDLMSRVILSQSADRVLGEIGGATWLAACGSEIGELLPRAVLVARALTEAGLVPASGVPESRTLLDQIEWRSFTLKTAKMGQWPADDGVDRNIAHCSGLSVVAVLAAATSSFLPRGLRAHREVGTDELSSMFRAAFDWHSIEKDELYWNLKKWEWVQRRYRVFKQWREYDAFHVLLDQRYIRSDLDYLCSAGIPRFSVFQLDLDHFREVNNTLGHVAGDAAIEMCERLVEEWLSGRGEVYRRGGDEILGFLMDLEPAQVDGEVDALRVSIERAFAEWPPARSLSSPPTASVGVVHCVRGCDAASLLDQVDGAQREAKATGKNRVCSVSCR